MKKLLNYSFLFFIAAIMMAGCKKNMLDQNPTSDIGSSAFWKTQNDADLALAGIYSYFIQGFNYTASGNTGQGFGAGTPYWETLTDNAYSSAYSNIAQGAITPTVGGLQTDAYTTSYRAIQACNTFLDNVGKIGMSSTTLTQYRAEVRFVRAYWYFLLTQLYGDVVLTTHQITIDPTNSMQARTPKSVVIDTILNDLNFAAGNLPNTAYSGHVVRGTALGYMVKVYMAQHQYQQAATMANTIISEGKFSIYNGGYRNLFLKPGQNGNPEIMLSGRYQVPTAYSPADYLYTYSSSFQPLNYLVDDYECKDGQPITTSPLYNSASPYANRDPRLLATILTPGVLYKGGIPFVPSQIGATAGFLNKKGVDSTRATVIGTQSDQDWVYLRYADVLLMYAEAKNEVSGPDASVYKAVNDVRTRPGVNMPVLPAGLSQADMRTRIRHERRIELALEGQRYFDLKRWALDRVIIPTIKDPNAAQRTFPLRDTLWPVPQAEIDIAKAVGNNAFKQTQGY
ncbi:putative outer membrane starch-binding protein [Mucilaginibacter yixingensis]|uniref:Putative outer membrane starch-binding protein n=1 Tax=Mucilaginibacter yixingensis TaxID=1295612 RepID=A0A2T5JGK8_9SPHI|nr:RagB/SusD family nutrient uptake outer membrane protein [Mucilaginibacter yixingensis]PTR01555.1 putative outer membrane starch-binding protein [Mucilaginibacter yixingensis]